jgi:hypothetical protein
MPAELRFAVDVWTKARLLPLLMLGRSLEGLTALAEADPDPRYIGIAPETVVRRVTKTLKHPVLMRGRRCLRGGILGYHFLRKCGYRPELYFGLDAASLERKRAAAHCWVCLDGRPVISSKPENMITIHIHPQGG